MYNRIKNFIQKNIKMNMQNKFDLSTFSVTCLSSCKFIAYFIHIAETGVKTQKLPFPMTGDAVIPNIRGIWQGLALQKSCTNATPG